MTEANPTPQDKEGEMLQNEFEAWMASSNYPEIADIALERLPDGTYKSQLTFAAWQAWQGAHNNMHSTLTEETARLKERVRVLEEALRPFADLGVGSGPDDEVDSQPYRILRGAIRRARSALHTPEVGG